MNNREFWLAVIGVAAVIAIYYYFEYTESEYLKKFIRETYAKPTKTRSAKK